jgi:hypothetical protein
MTPAELSAEVASARRMTLEHPDICTIEEGAIVALADALEAAQARIAELTAAGGGTLGELTEIIKADYMDAQTAAITAWFRSRLRPACPDSDSVVVRREELAELRAFARISGYPEGWFSYEVPLGKCMDDWGTDLSYRLKIEREEAQAWLDAQPATALRSRPSPTERKES